MSVWRSRQIEYFLEGGGGGLDACFSLLPLSTPPWDLPLPSITPTLHPFIVRPAEPARFTGLKWESIHSTGTAGGDRLEKGGVGGLR